MKLDTSIYSGDEKKPALVFIHGMGMDKHIWTEPSESRILGGKFPLSVLLNKSLFRKASGNLQTAFEDLKVKGYPVITWSQRRPSGLIDSVVNELFEILKIAQTLTETGVILIGHSRGGLIGRKYLMRQDIAIKGLITISTPHKGSSVAKVSQYITPLVKLINPLLPAGDRGTSRFAIKRIFEFLQSKALRELLSGSHFFKSLKDLQLYGVYYISMGGTSPTLFSINNLSVPDIFEKIIPESLYPEEMKKGKGDGLVTAESSMIPWAHEHHNFELNHAEILFDEEVRKLLVDTIERIEQM
jgi:pimeloyl-ACP methyl ester carboxylesterase